MTWHYRVLGTHTHVRVFVNGALAGTLCFRNEEFLKVYEKATSLERSYEENYVPFITFIEDGEDSSTVSEATDVGEAQS